MGGPGRNAPRGPHLGRVTGTMPGRASPRARSLPTGVQTWPVHVRGRGRPRPRRRRGGRRGHGVGQAPRGHLHRPGAVPRARPVARLGTRVAARGRGGVRRAVVGATRAATERLNPGDILRRPDARPGLHKEGEVGVKFLSAEWAQAVQDALNANEAFQGSVGSISAKVQQVVTGPAGEARYWFKVDGGQAGLGIGDSPEPVDATITQDYDTAVALSKNE